MPLRLCRFVQTSAKKPFGPGIIWTVRFGSAASSPSNHSRDRTVDFMIRKPRSIFGKLFATILSASNSVFPCETLNIVSLMKNSRAPMAITVAAHDQNYSDCSAHGDPSISRPALTAAIPSSLTPWRAARRVSANKNSRRPRPNYPEPRQITEALIQIQNPYRDAAFFSQSRSSTGRSGNASTGAARPRYRREAEDRRHIGHRPSSALPVQFSSE